MSTIVVQPAAGRVRRSTARNVSLRLAMKLHARLAASVLPAHSLLAEPMRDLLDAQHSLEQLWGKIQRCRQHEWLLAAAKLSDRLLPALRRVDQASSAADLAARGSAQPIIEPTVRDLLLELQALQQEFDEVHLDLKAAVVAVVTEPIVLQDISLGSFRIELRFSQLASSYGYAHAFAVVALQPNPASGSSSTTHPHVRDEQPCLGEATAPVNAALRDGRLVDSFLAVAAVLRTYNGSSPYVPLEEWDGSSCDDCGRYRSADEMSSCDGCGQQVCDHCSSSCDDCGNGYCRSCLELTPDDQELCASCRGRCDTCDAVVSSDQLDEQGRCRACVESSGAEADDDEPEHEAAEPLPAVSSPPTPPPSISPTHPSPEQHHVQSVIDFAAPADPALP